MIDPAYCWIKSSGIRTYPDCCRPTECARVSEEAWQRRAEVLSSAVLSSRTGERRASPSSPEARILRRSSAATAAFATLTMLHTSRTRALFWATVCLCDQSLFPFISDIALSSIWLCGSHRQSLARENGVVLAHSQELCHIDHSTQFRCPVVQSSIQQPGALVNNSFRCAGCLLLRCLAGLVMHHNPFGVHSCSLPLMHIASAASLLHCMPGVYPSSLHTFT